MKDFIKFLSSLLAFLRFSDNDLSSAPHRPKPQKVFGRPSEKEMINQIRWNIFQDRVQMELHPEKVVPQKPLFIDGFYVGPVTLYNFPTRMQASYGGGGYGVRMSSAHTTQYGAGSNYHSSGDSGFGTVGAIAIGFAIGSMF